MLEDLIREITQLRLAHNAANGNYDYPLDPYDLDPLEMLMRMSFVHGMQVIPDILQAYVNGWNDFAAMWIQRGPGVDPLELLAKSDKTLRDLCIYVKGKAITLPNITEEYIMHKLMRDNYCLRLELPLPSQRQKHISNFIRDLLLVRRTMIKDEEEEDSPARMDQDELSFLSELARGEIRPVQMCRVPAQMAAYTRGWNDNVLWRTAERYRVIPKPLPAMYQPYDIVTGMNYKPWSAFEDHKCNGTPERKFNKKQKDDCTFLSEVILGMLVLRRDMNALTQIYPKWMTYELSYICYLTRSAQPKMLRRVPLLYASYIWGWNDCTQGNEPLRLIKRNIPMYPTMVVTEEGMTMLAEQGLVLLANGSAEKANKFETDDITGYETLDTNWNVPGVVKKKKTEEASETEKVSGHTKEETCEHATAEASGCTTVEASVYAKKKDSRYAIGEASGYTTGEASGYTTGEASRYTTGEASGYATEGTSGYETEGASGYETEGASGYAAEGPYGYESEGAPGHEEAGVSEAGTAVRNGESEGGSENEEEPTGKKYEFGCRRLKSRLKRRMMNAKKKASNNQGNWTLSNIPYCFSYF